MTDNGIIKALECCDGTIAGCEMCPNYKNRYCCTIKRNALDLINRQKEEIEKLREAKYIFASVDDSLGDLEDALEEIERLQIENESLRMAGNSFIMHYNNARAEAIKDFADRLKIEAFLPLGTWFSETVVTESQIDNLVKEMTGDNDDDRGN